MTAVFVKINVETHYLWRAVDHEGEVLEVFANRRRDHKAAIKFLKRAVKLHGRSKAIVNDRLRSYRAAMNMIGTLCLKSAAVGSTITSIKTVTLAGLAGPGETLVSRTVKGLVAGSGTTFKDFGTHKLKGVPDDWQLFRAVG